MLICNADVLLSETDGHGHLHSLPGENRSVSSIHPVSSISKIKFGKLEKFASPDFANICQNFVKTLSNLCQTCSQQLATIDYCNIFECSINSFKLASFKNCWSTRYRKYGRHLRRRQLTTAEQALIPSVGAANWLLSIY